MRKHISRSGVLVWPSEFPKPIAEQWGVEEGSAIEFVPRGDRLVLQKKAYDLNEMLAAVGTDNLHPEVDAGPAQGGEEW